MLESFAGNYLDVLVSRARFCFSVSSVKSSFWHLGTSLFTPRSFKRSSDGKLATSSLNDTPGKWPIYRRAYTRETSDPATSSCHPSTSSFSPPPAAILAMFFSPLVVTSGVAPLH